MTWRVNRNKSRAVLEEKFGYDTKHASHLFRLIWEADELLSTGYITFPLPNASEILEIKNGKYSYGEVISLVDTYEEKFENMYNKSILPHSPNEKRIRELYLEILVERFGINTEV